MGLYNKIWSYPKPFYVAEITDQEFIERRKEHLDKIFKTQKLPSVDEIAKEKKFVVAFSWWIWYLQAWTSVIYFIENEVEPWKYFPEGRKDWDPIPTETIGRIVAAKLWFSYEAFMELAWVKKEWDFTPTN